MSGTGPHGPVRRLSEKACDLRFRGPAGRRDVAQHPNSLTLCQIVTSILPAGRLVVGMQLPIQSQSTIYAEPWEADAGADELAAVARAADESGFWYVAVCDHIAIPAEQAKTMSTSWWDTVATLGWLAGITSRTRLLSHIYVLPFRHPLVAAKAFSTLDAVSGGRVDPRRRCRTRGGRVRAARPRVR